MRARVVVGRSGAAVLRAPEQGASVTQLWRNFSDLAAVVTVVGAVVAGGVFLGCWAYRGTERSSSAVCRSVGEALVVVWALVLATVTLRPLPHTGEADPELVPFRDLGSYAQASWPATVGQVGGSLLLFGLGGALLAARLGWGPWRAALATATTGVVIEVLQHVLVTGRRATTDDVLVAVAAASAVALDLRPGTALTLRVDAADVRARSV